MATKNIPIALDRPQPDGTFDLALIFRSDLTNPDPTHYVVCSAYNPQVGDWYNGHYFADLHDALNYYESRDGETNPHNVTTVYDRDGHAIDPRRHYSWYNDTEVIICSKHGLQQTCTCQLVNGEGTTKELKGSELIPIESI